jgi:NADH dehydrogenase
VRLTLIDQHNYHLFQPLLYQVATASLSPADIASPIRAILRRQRNARVELARVESVDLRRKRVMLSDGEVQCDFLVLAAGAEPAYFGHPEWAELAPGPKSLDDALDMRRRIFRAFERAERTTDERERRRALTFVVVGGGPTGVELAGAIGEIAHHTLPREFRRIDPHSTRIILVEGGDRILESFPENLSRRAERDLERLGVEIRTRTRVTRIQPDAVWLGHERLGADTVLWAAGVSASPIV